MALKTDYKDAIFQDARKYKETVNGDGSKSFSDVTTYTVKGDRFGAKDINATNTAVNALSSIRVTFPASGWSSSAPYTQTVAVSGIKSTDNLGAPELELSGNVDTDRGALTALSYVSGGSTSNGGITLFCYDAKPTVNLPIIFTRRQL